MLRFKIKPMLVGDRTERVEAGDAKVPRRIQVTPAGAIILQPLRVGNGGTRKAVKPAFAP